MSQPGPGPKPDGPTHPTPTGPGRDLTVAEADLLAECEVVIERGMGVFVEVGTALMSVRDNRLYRAEFPTFEDYCRERWSLSLPYANQMINASRVVETITAAIASEIEPVAIPGTESQARELAPLLDQPEQLRDAWAQANQATGGRPTAAAIRQIVQEVTAEVTAEVEAEQAEIERQREATEHINTLTADAAARHRDDLGIDITWPIIRALERLTEQPAPADVAAAWPGHLRERLEAVIGPAHQWLADLYKHWDGQP